MLFHVSISIQCQIRYVLRNYCISVSLLLLNSVLPTVGLVLCTASNLHLDLKT